LRDLRIALLVLLCSSVVAVAANLVRAKPLTWIRDPLPTSQPAITTTMLAIAGAPPATSPATSAPAAPRPGIATIDDVLTHLANRTAHFIDARANHEYLEGHLRGAINLPSEAIYQQINSVIDIVPPIDKVIVYCGGGQCEASHNVSDALRRDFGFTDVLIYEKGWEEVFTTPSMRQYISTGNQP
jgi:rhodanese-related sulfurtransferase